MVSFFRPFPYGCDTLVLHGRYQTEVVVAQPWRQVQGPVTVVVGTGTVESTHEQGQVTVSRRRHMGV